MRHQKYWRTWLLHIVANVVIALSLAPTPVRADRGSAAQLPLTKIVLYTSGVGYFQREGQVEGTQQLTVRFKVQEINDLLKSLVLQDFDGGQVGVVTYDSREPIATALKSFAIDLTTNPTLGQLLQQLRGQPVELVTPNDIRGTILGVETRREQVNKDQVVDISYLNLLTKDGLRSIALPQIQRLVLSNTQLNTELEQALTVLASGQDTRKKTVVFDFVGTGRRQVRIAYVGAVPVWKTSYRLVLSESEAPFLQGWAIVENTSDEDWTNLQLSLVSGQPMSFVMDLYTPLFAERPVVVPELYASLHPPEYEQSIGTESESIGGQRAESQMESAPPMRQLSSKRSSLSNKPQSFPQSPAPDAPLDLQRGIQSAAQSGELGELFEYVIKTPVSLTRQKSAMLPIVNEPIDGVKLSIYNEQVHSHHPLSGFRLYNKTDLHFMQGPVTVFDAGVYAGDARLADLAPGQERLISYAMDLSIEVEPVVASTQRELLTASLRKGVLVVKRRAISEKTYTARNRDQHAKTLLIEHPFRPDWTLTTPQKATSRTREVYRFELSVAPNETAILRVREEQPRQQIVRLMDVGPDVMAHYVSANEVSPEVKTALQQVIKLRTKLDHTIRLRQKLEHRLAEIAVDQQRIRPNMERLSRNAELYARYVRKLDDQETELESLRTEIKKQVATETTQRTALETYLLNLELD